MPHILMGHDLGRLLISHTCLPLVTLPSSVVAPLYVTALPAPPLPSLVLLSTVPIGDR
jgi:hypothetical protein